ncbi:MAG: hypothetical protein J0L82_07605 [Deltaproteobacteria bacterium]|nr:hypothetical protein [Deltaproteobacteria bacterium]
MYLKFVVMGSVSILLLGSGLAKAQSSASIKEISKRTVQMPRITDCKKQDVCDLKSVKIVERKLKVLLPDERPEFASYMTDFRFVLQLDKPSSIPRYGIVQYMKGCMFQSELLPDGTVSNRFAYVHKHFGAYQLVRHDNWVVDSSHDDPVTSSLENYGRFDLYRWNKDPKSLDADNAAWYFDAQPPHGTVFKSELLLNTGLMEGTGNPMARNSSIELETCIFKIGDLPLKSDAAGTGIDRSKALWCGQWDHKFSYDFANGKVVPDQAIHSYCAEPSDWPL